MTSQKSMIMTPTLLAAVILGISLVAAPVLAASPHFIGTPTIVKNPNGSLTATFKAAGLGNIVTGAFLTCEFRSIARSDNLYPTE